MRRCTKVLSGVERTDTAAGGLRAARPADLDSLVALDRLCFGARAWRREEWWEAIVEPGLVTLVVENGGALVAALVEMTWPPDASVASLAVHPRWRGRGIGAWLLRVADHLARSARARWLTLDVDADNVRAISLYRRAGYGVCRRFREDGRLRLGMVRRLAGPVRRRP